MDGETIVKTVWITEWLYIEITMEESGTYQYNAFMEEYGEREWQHYGNGFATPQDAVKNAKRIYAD